MIMNAFARIPTHVDYAHQIAALAAEMAGYKLDDLCQPGLPIDPARHRLYSSFVKKGFDVADLLGPAAVSLDPVDAEKVPAAIRDEGDTKGWHALMTIRLWRGMSVEELAERSGLSGDLIRAIEAREAVGNEMHDAAMARILNVSPHALADWRVNPEDPRIVEKLARESARENNTALDQETMIEPKKP